jgi:hypothetical protein
MRGLPGSGKSTWVKTRISLHKPGEVVVCSSDQFFVCPKCDTYHFDRSKLPFAHAWCQAECERHLKDDKAVAIIIDNTNTTPAECRPYVELGVKYEALISFVEIPFWEFSDEQLCERNVHGVPLTTIRAMRARFVRNMTIELALSEPTVDELSARWGHAARRAHPPA